MEALINQKERTHTFEVEGTVQGETMRGTFVVKYPSIIDDLNYEKRLSSMLKGANMETYSQAAYLITKQIALIEELAIEKPEWFVIENLDDYEILGKVYTEVMNYIDSFRTKDERDQHTGLSGEKGDSSTLEDK